MRSGKTHCDMKLQKPEISERTEALWTIGIVALAAAAGWSLGRASDGIFLGVMASSMMSFVLSKKRGRISAKSANLMLWLSAALAAAFVAWQLYKAYG